jgi:phenylacetate-CoA ligase
MIARDRWPRQRVLEFQRRRPRELVAHAVSASPYYRDALGPHLRDGDIRLDRLPTLPKATLVEQFDRIVTDPRIRLTALERHLDGAGADDRHLDRYRVYATSGTSGLRAPIVYSKEEFRSSTPTRTSWWSRSSTRTTGRSRRASRGARCSSRTS